MAKIPLSVGQIVLYVLNSSARSGQIRPAIITKVSAQQSDKTNPGQVNLSVFLDGTNDTGEAAWVQNVLFSRTSVPGTWHYPT